MRTIGGRIRRGRGRSFGLYCGEADEGAARLTASRVGTSSSHRMRKGKNQQNADHADFADFADFADCSEKATFNRAGPTSRCFPVGTVSIRGIRVIRVGVAVAVPIMNELDARSELRSATRSSASRLVLPLHPSHPSHPMRLRHRCPHAQFRPLPRLRDQQHAGAEP